MAWQKQSQDKVVTYSESYDLFGIINLQIKYSSLNSNLKMIESFHFNVSKGIALFNENFKVIPEDIGYLDKSKFILKVLDDGYSPEDPSELKVKKILHTIRDRKKVILNIIKILYENFGFPKKSHNVLRIEIDNSFTLQGGIKLLFTYFEADKIIRDLEERNENNKRRMKYLSPDEKENEQKQLAVVTTLINRIENLKLAFIKLNKSNIAIKKPIFSVTELLFLLKLENYWSSEITQRMHLAFLREFGVEISNKIVPTYEAVFPSYLPGLCPNCGKTSFAIHFSSSGLIKFIQIEIEKNYESFFNFYNISQSLGRYDTESQIFEIWPLDTFLPKITGESETDLWNQRRERKWKQEATFQGLSSVIGTFSALALSNFSQERVGIELKNRLMINLTLEGALASALTMLKDSSDFKIKYLAWLITNRKFRYSEKQFDFLMEKIIQSLLDKQPSEFVTQDRQVILALPEFMQKYENSDQLRWSALCEGFEITEINKVLDQFLKIKQISNAPIFKMRLAATLDSLKKSLNFKKAYLSWLKLNRSLDYPEEQLNLLMGKAIKSLLSEQLLKLITKDREVILAISDFMKEYKCSISRWNELCEEFDVENIQYFLKHFLKVDAFTYNNLLKRVFAEKDIGKNSMFTQQIAEQESQSINEKIISQSPIAESCSAEAPVLVDENDLYNYKLLS